MLAATMAGCAGAPDMYRSTRSDPVDQRLLSPSLSGGQSGQVESYAMQPQQVFRMPLLQDNVDPTLPADTARKELPPTTVCMRVMIDASGAVLRTERLLDRAECMAGADPANADLLQAVDRAALAWHYAPAAICHYRDLAPERAADCAGAERIEPVPVTLNYAFTLQMTRGQMRVRRAGR